MWLENNELNIIACLVCTQGKVVCVDEAAVKDKDAVKLKLKTISSCVSTFQTGKSKYIEIRYRSDTGGKMTGN